LNRNRGEQDCVSGRIVATEDANTSVGKRRDHFTYNVSLRRIATWVVPDRRNA
jgi:hypothetical protein